MPIRSELQLRKAREADRERALAAELRLPRPPPPPPPNPLATAQRLQWLYPQYVCRDPMTFTRRLRTRDSGKIALLAADFVFRLYPAPRHVRAVWLEPLPWTSVAEPTAVTQAREFRRKLYLATVSGGSVHKACTGDFMTKKETHRFLGLSHTDSFVEAVWFALARSFTDDVGVARRMSVSRIAEQPYADPFWREVLRFFCLNPIPIARLNDTLDFARQARAENPQWSIHGRTLASLAELVEQWHRALARTRRMGDAKWDGVDVPDALYPDEPSIKGSRRSAWRFTQIRSSRDLAEEGTKMHHCVYAYQPLCIDGRSSIWSLKTRPANRDEAAPWSRALTIEMDNAGRRLVQLRGYANRSVNPEERGIVARWASENGLSIARWA